MLFNTAEYFFFFSTVLLVYFALPFRAQNLWLLLASYFFYGSWDWRILSLLLLSTVIDYTAGLAIQAARERHNPRAMRIALTASVGGQLVILAFFKYFNFFAESPDSNSTHRRNRIPRVVRASRPRCVEIQSEE